MPAHHFDHHAMATRFELRIACEDAGYARQAAQECFTELDFLETQLSRFEESSEVSCINRLRPGERLRVTLDTFDCLHIALELHALTGGAFDPTLGHVLDAVKAGDLASMPQGARGKLLLDSNSLEVEVQGGEIGLDLGAIGKGFALDRMGETLKLWEIDHALLISGGSSILALGEAAPDQPWIATLGDGTAQKKVILRDEALGASGITVKGEHIIDPLSRLPARRAYRTWAISKTAAEADALSTAWMNLSSAEIAEVCRLRPGISATLQLTDTPNLPLKHLGRLPRFA